MYAGELNAVSKGSDKCPDVGSSVHCTLLCICDSAYLEFRGCLVPRPAAGSQVYLDAFRFEKPICVQLGGAGCTLWSVEPQKQTGCSRASLPKGQTEHAVDRHQTVVEAPSSFAIELLAQMQHSTSRSLQNPLKRRLPSEVPPHLSSESRW